MKSKQCDVPSLNQRELKDFGTIEIFVGVFCFLFLLMLLQASSIATAAEDKNSQIV